MKSALFRHGLGFALLGAVLALCSSCESGSPQPAAADDGTSGDHHVPALCVDEDGDGYGLGCTRGNDCDDEDASFTVSCQCDSRPSPGCPCEEQGQSASCGRAYAKIGSQLMCGQGVTTCADGHWGECVLTGDISLVESSKTQALGGGTTCTTNPCDPGCITFLDTPQNVVVPSTLKGDSTGITLPGDGNTSAPPVGGGFGCSGGSYPKSSGSCSHHICETGAALSASCDNLGAGSTTTTFLSDTFASSSVGWVLDTSWAIGATAVSTGHTTGNPDPASDVTPTSDNGVAGTVLAGNIGGGVELFSDSFTSLGSWTQTGKGNWNTESLNSTNQYPSSGSGSPAAHCDSCTTSCTITKTTGVNLLGQTSATLSLLRYLSNTLDDGEYLKLEIFNGLVWSQLANWVAPADDDGAWHAESFNLPLTYMVNGFKLRFVTMESASDEHVHVDDVKITVPPALQTRYMTSPAFNSTTVNGSLKLTFSRWLNVEAALARTATIDVYNGLAWVNVWTNVGAVSDSAWTTQTIDLTAYKNAAMKVRFGWSGAATSKVSGWNIDDLSIVGTNNVAGSPFCVSAVCAQDPTCCVLGWHAGCLARVKTACKIDCSKDSSTNECVACYRDPALTTDFDGDGFSPAQGDCQECDAGVNPGAYDFPSNSVDEDCDGTADNAVATCDSALTQLGDAWDHAKAIGLCKVATSSSWGVMSADFVQANGTTACTNTLQREIASTFGSGNLPTEGSKLSVFSSGTARTSSESGYVQPNGNGYAPNTSSTPAYAVPAASGCSAGTAGNDSCGLKLKIRAPTNAKSFAFNFDFFTSEYPEWVCTAYNDAFVAYYLGSLNTQTNKNISFDSVGNPVSVNNGLFSIPGVTPPPSSGSHVKLNGSGFDGVCANNYSGTKYSANSICGGATGWLNTSAPVKPGEEITLQFSIWDTGDHKWDSTVLLDHFSWSASAASIVTGLYDPGTAGSTPFMAASFVRDYDMSTSCGKSQKPVWSLWSWSAATPSDSKVQFFVTTASTAAGLDTAPEDTLLFSNPPGPTTLAGQPAVAQGGATPTQTGSASVVNTLTSKGRLPNQGFLRVRSYLVPSADGKSAPKLTSWNLQASCVDSE